MSSCSSTDSEERLPPVETEEQKLAKLSAKGRKMANSIAEFILMRFYFPKLRDRKKQIYWKQQFMHDMQYNLARGSVKNVTEIFKKRRQKEGVLRVLEDDSGQLLPDQDEKLIGDLFKDIRWGGVTADFTKQDQQDLMRSFKVRKYLAGQRIGAHSDLIDQYNIIVDGSVGILYPDPDIAKSISQASVVCCNETQAEGLRAEAARLLKEKKERINTYNRTLEAFTTLVSHKSKSRRDEPNPLSTLKTNDLLQMDSHFINKALLQSRLIEPPKVFVEDKGLTYRQMMPPLEEEWAPRLNTTFQKTHTLSKAKPRVNQPIKASVTFITANNDGAGGRNQAESIIEKDDEDVVSTKDDQLPKQR